MKGNYVSSFDRFEVLLVGDEESGKTTLLKKIKSTEPRPAPTGKHATVVQPRTCSPEDMRESYLRISLAKERVQVKFYETRFPDSIECFSDILPKFSGMVYVLNLEKFDEIDNISGVPFLDLELKRFSELFKMTSSRRIHSLLVWTKEDVFEEKIRNNCKLPRRGAFSNFNGQMYNNPAKVREYILERFEEVVKPLDLLSYYLRVPVSSNEITAARVFECMNTQIFMKQIIATH